MTTSDRVRTATVGATEHGNAMVLVALSANGDLLDRRTADLTEGLPTHPYHHQGSWAVGRYMDSPWAKETSLPDAIALVEEVQKAAAIGARKVLNALQQSVGEAIGAIAIRECPELPPTIEARIRDNRAQTMADTVMYRQALAAAAQADGWSVYWYVKDELFDEASDMLGEDAKHVITALGKSAGPPWQAKHKQAAAAAIVARRLV